MRGREMKALRSAAFRREEDEGCTDPSSEFVLVVDHSPFFAEALARLLAREGLHAAHASFAEAAREAGSRQPTLLLIDGDQDWHQVLTCALAVSAASAQVRTLLLVNADDALSDALAEQAGARGWVSRSTGSRDLLEAIRLTRSGPLPRSGRRGAGRRSPNASHRRRSDSLGPLTDRQLQVLEALANGLRDPVIAANLGISAHTVRTHVQNILAKLDVHTRHQAVAVARRAGLRPMPAGNGHGQGR